MSEIRPPKYVRQVLVTLQSRGFAAYLVGGCVRDVLLGVRPNDWDVCTGALPEQVLALFPGSRPTGLRHGTVTVVLGSRQVEVTTFRTESGYADHRRPDAVSFVGDLTADLSRRDFTMNAIALSADGVLHDPFGGVEDIRRRLIRCVGVPTERFEEDALRMLRALRFSARLGFDIDLITLDAIREKAPLAALLAAERVRDELEKTLLSPAPETVFTMSDLGLLERYLLRPLPPDVPLGRLRELPRRRGERWTALCVLL
ncbi:MAG: tRNA nucleotidyltransferase, partial [Oscillospiraceae bacterium]|nr:tRNA nucleotidyltransferase [Oscillospiraceae bacterium]